MKIRHRRAAVRRQLRRRGAARSTDRVSDLAACGLIARARGRPFPALSSLRP